MSVHIYAKTSEDITSFDDIVDIVAENKEEIFISIENKRSFRELENVKKQCGTDDIVVISSLASLGMNHNQIMEQLSWFIRNSVALVICEITSTYEFGIAQPMNQAVLSTLLQSMKNSNRNVTAVSFKKSSVGRNKVEFPDNWDELYEKWTKKQITSKKFIEEAGLKKATFYNLLTEYREIQDMNHKYVKRYKEG